MQSKCAHCQSHRFELHTESPEKAAFKVNFIRCAGCKNPIGVMDYYDIHTSVKALENKLIALGDIVTSSLQTIDHNIRLLGQK